MKNPFRTITVEETLKRQLLAARLEFLDAVGFAEDWASKAEMLNRRVKRLEGYFQPVSPLETPQTEAEHGN